MITLTKKQGEAVSLMSTRFAMREPVTVIGGYAGTGKSSIINYFIENNSLMDKTRFVTFTGKASLVLQNKGLPATTIHRLIYDAFKNKFTGKFIFRKKKVLDPSIKLIVIDEVSMVPDNLLRDLASFSIPVIALGDPGQLEPIGRDNGLLSSPDYFLEEIHRQAEDNSIIRLSKMIREGKPIAGFENDSNVKIVTRADVSLSMLNWADQIICGKNVTRRGINADVRKSLGFEGVYPNVGEKVICLRNYWDTINDSEHPLINGTIAIVEKSDKPKEADSQSILSENCVLSLNADYSEADWENIRIDSNIFKGFAPFSEKHPQSSQIYHEFDYGYAITTHKSQGSEFSKVLLFEERLRGDHKKLFYTGVTRAVDQIVVVKA